MIQRIIAWGNCGAIMKQRNQGKVQGDTAISKNKH